VSEALIRRGKGGLLSPKFTGPNGSSKLTTFGQLIGQENNQRITRMRQIILTRIISANISIFF